MKSNHIFVRMKKKITVDQEQKISIRDVAFILCPKHLQESLLEIPVYQITKQDNEYIVIDAFIVIMLIKKLAPHSDVQIVGANETIIQVKHKRKRTNLFIVSLVWIILFVGTAMTMMNFHYDVSMQEVQQRIHYLITGENVSHPLWIQIPYSFGLGIGMILFLNHWFKKRINEEPSPLELELYNYQKNIDDYVIEYENELNDDERYF